MVKNNNQEGQFDNIKEHLKFTDGIMLLEKKISDEIEKKTFECNFLKETQRELNRLKSLYDVDIHKIWKSKKKRISNGEKTGFVKIKKIPLKFSQLIGFDKSIDMSMPEYTKKFIEFLTNNNLVYNNDKRVYRANKEVRDLLDLPESVNQSINHTDQNGFNFCTLQRLLSKAMKKHDARNSSDKNNNKNSNIKTNNDKSDGDDYVSDPEISTTKNNKKNKYKIHSSST